MIVSLQVKVITFFIFLKMKLLKHRSNSSVINFVSRLFQPSNIVPRNAEVKSILMPKSQKVEKSITEFCLAGNNKTNLLQSCLLHYHLNGLIRQSSNGIYHLLPLGLRSLNKLIDLIDRNMKEIGASKFQMPVLTEGKHWKASGRWNTDGLNLFKLKDKSHKDYILSPTHEESIANLISAIPHLSHKSLPLLLYQITTKFRDETHPRAGLLRGREFIMKDLYSFHSTVDDANEFYQIVSRVYEKIFLELSLPMLQAVASQDMDVEMSHEFHVPSEIGEDVVWLCQHCSSCFNKEVLTQEKNQFDESVCSNCKRSDAIINFNCIEVGHSFFLGTKYTEIFKSHYLNSEGKPKLLQMCSFGLGVTRILSALIEVLSLPEEIRWPPCIAPFSVIIIPPKSGSKEEQNLGNNFCLDLYHKLTSLPGLEDDILYDDRTNLSIGRRLYDAKRMGYPHVVIIGQKATDTMNPLFEILSLGDGIEEKPKFCSLDGLSNYLISSTSAHLNLKYDIYS